VLLQPEVRRVGLSVLVAFVDHLTLRHLLPAPGNRAATNIASQPDTTVARGRSSGDRSQLEGWPPRTI
jgi:hypothetical protein